MPKIEPVVVCAVHNIVSKFQKDPSITFWVILLTYRQTNRQTKTGKNITSLAEVKIVQILKKVGKYLIITSESSYAFSAS